MSDDVNAFTNCHRISALDTKKITDATSPAAYFSHEGSMETSHFSL